MEKKESFQPQPIAWNFVPYTQGRILLNRTLTWEDPCYSSITVQITGLNSTDCTLQIVTGKKKVPLCTSLYNLNTREKGFFLELTLEGHTYKKVETLVQYEYDDITARGWVAFYWPLGVVGTIESIANTVLLFGSPDMEGKKNKLEKNGFDLLII